jgi:hypothetical protein
MIMGDNCFSWVQLIKKSDLPANAKYIALYLSTFMNLEQDIAWPSQSRISNETGLSTRTVIRYLQQLEAESWLICRKAAKSVDTGKQHYLHNEYLINVPEKVKQQIRDDILAPQIKAGVTQVSSRGDKEGVSGVTQCHTNNNIITNNNKKGKSKFSPPSLSDVHAYISEKSLQVDAQHFIDFYESKGWMVGKNKMKDWKAAIRTWHSRDKKDNPAPRPMKGTFEKPPERTPEQLAKDREAGRKALEMMKNGK